jgi:hypothetical protein
VGRRLQSAAEETRIEWEEGSRPCAVYSPSKAQCFCGSLRTYDYASSRNASTQGRPAAVLPVSARARKEPGNLSTRRLEERVDLRCIDRPIRWMMRGGRHAREVEESFSKASTIVIRYEQRCGCGEDEAGRCNWVHGAERCGADDRERGARQFSELVGAGV